MNPKRFPRGLYAPERLESRIAPATFTVTSLLDPALDTAGTLRHAIGDANAQPDADTIVFAKGLTGTILLNGTELLIKEALTIKGPGIDLLSISGGDLSRIFNIDDGTAALRPTAISGLTLADGKTTGDGGALYSAEPLTLKNVVIRSSEAVGDGGGIFVKTTGKISVVSSSIVHNKADSRGGAFLDGGAGVTVVKTTVADNTAANRGGLYCNVNDAKAVILVDSCNIANNTATAGKGGGLSVDGDGPSRILVKNSLITGNTATDIGGGLYMDTGILLITKTTFSRNSAAAGGALFAGEATSVTISGSAFLGNQATDPLGGGGGALFLEEPGVAVKISSTLFSGNHSAARSGAIGHAGALTIDITGSSFLGNTSDVAAGAIYMQDAGVLTMKSSVLSGNTGGMVGGALAAATGAVLNLTGNRFTENGADSGGAIRMNGAGANATTAHLSGNLFQGNVADTSGGAILAGQAAIFTSKGDRFISNIAHTGQGGGLYLTNTGGITITGSLIQGNVAASSGGGAIIGAGATLTSVKVLDNIAGPGGRGGGLRIAGGTVVIAKSLLTGNVASDGGGVFFNVGTTTLPGTVVKGNAAGLNPNLGSA